MVLVEYLYVDEKRLDTYFEQISSPATYDKVPEWNAEISITGPKGGVKQPRFARPYTVHEKITKLTEYLEDEGLVAYGRPSGQSYEATFRIETCRAKRVFIPPDHGQPPEAGALALWISAVPRTREEIEAILEREGQFEGPAPFSSRGPGNLYLLEDYRRSDEEHTTMGFSPFSAIFLLVAPTKSDSPNASPQLYFGNLIPAWNEPSFYLGWVDLDAADKLKPSVKTQLEKSSLPDEQKRAYRQHLSFSSYFLIDPAAALAQIGAQIGLERKIRTLYRVRMSFAEEELAWNYDQWDMATFGYPIFIAEDADAI